MEEWENVRVLIWAGAEEVMRLPVREIGLSEHSLDAVVGKILERSVSLSEPWMESCLSRLVRCA